MSREQSEQQNGERRLNIGLVVANVEDDFSNKICKGAMRAAETADVNLFIFPAKYLDHREDELADTKQAYEYQYNALIDFANAATLDMVLICISSIGYLSSKERCDEVLSRFKGIPLMLLASAKEGHSSIVYDNRAGLSNAVRYLIRDKKKTRIGMLAGSRDNMDANERLEVYKTVLEEEGIGVDERLICYTNYSSACEDTVEAFLIENPDVEALVCANDSVAQAAYKVLKRGDRVIGQDVLVTGFDDIDEAIRMTPQLATVRADAELLGHRAVMEAQQMLCGQPRGEAVHPKNVTVKTDFILRESASGQMELDNINREYLEEYRQRLKMMLDMNHSLNIVNRDTLMFGADNVRDYTKILDVFNVSVIHDYYLYLFKAPRTYLPGKRFKRPEEIYLRAYRNGDEVKELPRVDQRMKFEQMYENPYLQKERKTYILIDIYSREQQYGVLMCDLPYEYLHYLEALCYQVSIAVKMKELFSVQEGLLAEKEDMLRKLEQENLALDNISNKDELTGICNRRGFFTKAEKMLVQKEFFGKRVAAVYADLNYLKQINDRFGHEEGDFSLKSCAAALESALSSRGVVGRIGGDEFAGLLVLEKNEEAEEIRVRMKAYLNEVNESAGKRYPIMASLGIMEQQITGELQLKELLEQADDLLYEEKKKKGPFIVRED
ncbi:MAG: GGDEF domain-containing protein [Lachnospiraceae bacterium]|nr:GGDEF domain-containing protein [Lachnospiraceae bacterium]